MKYAHLASRNDGILLTVQFSETAKNWADVDLRRPLSAVLNRVSLIRPINDSLEMV